MPLPNLSKTSICCARRWAEGSLSPSSSTSTSFVSRSSLNNFKRIFLSGLANTIPPPVNLAWLTCAETLSKPSSSHDKTSFAWICISFSPASSDTRFLNSRLSTCLNSLQTSKLHLFNSTESCIASFSATTFCKFPRCSSTSLAAFLTIVGVNLLCIPLRTRSGRLWASSTITTRSSRRNPIAFNDAVRTPSMNR